MEIDKRLLLFQKYLSTNELALVQSTWQSGGLLDPNWSNIADHLCAVAALAGTFCDIAPTVTRDALVAALLHDAFKVQEILAKKASNNNPSVLDAMVEKQEAFLRSHFWSETIIDATSAVGHTSLYRFYIGKEQSLVCKIVHLADSLTDEDQFPMLEVRMAKNRLRYNTIQATDPAKYGLPLGRTMFGIQEEIAFSLLCEFGDLVGLQPRAYHVACIEKANAILGRS